MSTLSQLLVAEATEYEFKSTVEANRPRSWLKTVSAFANGVGGSIYIGVSAVLTHLITTRLTRTKSPITESGTNQFPLRRRHVDLCRRALCRPMPDLSIKGVLYPLEWT